MSTPISSHFVCATVPVLSHVSPLIGLCVLLLLQHPGLALTVFVPNNLTAYTESQILAQTCGLTKESDGAGAETLVERFRLFVFSERVPTPDDYPGPLVQFMVQQMLESGTSFPTTFKALLNSEEVTDARGKVFPSILPPTLIIADTFAFYLTDSPVANAIPSEMKILTFVVTITGSLAIIFADNNLEMEASAQAAYADVATRGERTLIDFRDEQLAKLNSLDVIKVPGYPDVYRHELMPQNWPFQGLLQLRASAQKVKDRSIGIIALSSPCLEPETLPYIRAGDPNSVLITFLPRIAPTFKAAATIQAEAESPAAADRACVLSFLEGKPDNSVVYISFGSIFHPSFVSPEAFRALVEVLLEANQPWSFVLAKGSPLAVLQDDLLERIEKSGKGVCVSWAPQREALAHPAVGLMVSHGGSGGTFEALQSSVPLLFWPIAADQPAMAQLFTSPLHSVGLELVQVRTGPGAADSLPHGKIYGTVDAIKEEMRVKLAKFWGVEGEGFRRRVTELSAKLAAARAPGGDSDLALGAFVKYM